MVSFTVDRLIHLGKMAVRLSEQYMDYRRKEGIIHHILFGALETKFGYMEREYLPAAGQDRIDFRYATSNPRVIELVVRDPLHSNQHYGSENRSEINKLCLVSTNKARTRILLILDASGVSQPFSKGRLKVSYDRVKSTRGNYKRYPVSVIYVHPKLDYRFTWEP